MLSLRTCLTISLVAACGPKPPQTETTDGDTSTGATGSGTTSAPTTSSTTALDPTTAPISTGADTSAGFMLPPDEGVSFIKPLDGGSNCGCGSVANLGLRCKPCETWLQDCPEGEKCTPTACNPDDEWDSHKCIPLPEHPDHAGEPCTVEGSVASGVDSCDLATMCWFIDPDTLTGVCTPYCTGSPDQPVCADGTTCMIGNDAVLSLCLPICDPLGDDCAAGQLCILNHTTNTDFFCTADDSGAGGQLFAPCDFPDACDPGLLCADATLALECDPMSPGCCLPYCDLTMPAPCPGAMQECLPFFPDDPPPGHDDLGICRLPG